MLICFLYFCGEYKVYMDRIDKLLDDLKAVLLNNRKHIVHVSFPYVRPLEIKT